MFERFDVNSPKKCLVLKPFLLSSAKQAAFFKTRQNGALTNACFCAGLPTQFKTEPASVEGASEKILGILPKTYTKIVKNNPKMGAHVLSMSSPPQTFVAGGKFRLPSPLPPQKPPKLGAKENLVNVES